MYQAEDIANYIIRKYNAEDRLLTNLRLQRLLYLAQKEFLQQGKVLFADDFIAEKSGPILENLYFKHYSKEELANVFVTVEEIERIYANCKISEIDRDTLEEFLDRTKSIASFDIAALVVKKEGAWDKTVNTKGYKNVISKRMIKKY